MNKNSYFSNAAKFLLIGTALTFAAKLLSLMNTFSLSGGGVQALLKNITDISFYGFLILAFLALNGEGIAHKRNREYKKKRVTSRLKFLIVADLLILLVKNYLSVKAVASPVQSVSGIIKRIIISLIICICSVSFTLFAISVWYFIRDRRFDKAQIVELIAVIISGIYFVVRLINQLSVFNFHIFGENIESIMSSTLFTGILCLLQYASNITVFAVLYKHFSSDSGKVNEENTKLSRHANTLYFENGFGLDSADELLLFKNNC